MMKAKSKSRQLRESAEQLVRYAVNKRSHSKENRMLQTADHRNYSNQYIPLAHHFPEHVKPREFSSSKNCRKESKPVQIEMILPRSPYETKEKRPASSKIFIGSKLKKKLQKYLLLLSLVNYSLRVSYQRSAVTKYKVFIGKGNNSKLVRSLFAGRFWWQPAQEQSEAHLVWTQRSKRKVFRSMQNAQEIDPREREQDIPVRKMKGRRRQSKKTACELESILCEKDRQALRNECGRRECFEQQLKAFLKRNKQQKRQAVQRTHNHIQNHRLLTNKKNLFLNLKHYCEQQNDNPFNYVPLTFHITKNTEEQYSGLLAHEQSQSKKDKDKLLWIVKPGENSNRGCGIEVCRKVQQVRKHIEKCLVKHPQRTFIVQKYISPYLFHRRKFDIRCFVLVTASPHISAYFYPKGYLRTSSFQFSLKNFSNKYIHLTNDAIQKKASEYSKFQSGNKVTFQGFQKYLDLFHTRPHLLSTPNFQQDILPLIRELVILSIRSSRDFGKSAKMHSFQILGYDFMLDQDLRPWLIEINTNPCLQTSCEVLDSIIPAMLENAIKIAVDSVFKPPKVDEWSLKELLGCSERLLQGNKFQLIYSQLHDS